MSPIIILIGFLVFIVIIAMIVWRLIKVVRRHQQTEKASAGLNEMLQGCSAMF